MWAKRVDDTDIPHVGNGVRALKGSISTSDTNSLPSRGMMTADGVTLAPMTSEKGRGRGGLASGTSAANRDDILQSTSHTCSQRSNDDSGQNVAGCNCIGKGCNTAPQETPGGAFASNCPSRMDREKGGGENRTVPRGEARWYEACCYAGSRDAERASPKRMDNTSYLGRAWMISGRCVLSIASLAGRSAVSLPFVTCFSLIFMLEDRKRPFCYV